MHITIMQSGKNHVKGVQGIAKTIGGQVSRMDRKEAINILSLRRQNAIGTLGSTPREANNTAINVLVDEIYAYEMAIEALDKQIPKKPVSKYKYRDGENVCPSCETENRCRIVMFWEKFCPDCGQAIDWEAEE